MKDPKKALKHLYQAQRRLNKYASTEHIKECREGVKKAIARFEKQLIEEEKLKQKTSYEIMLHKKKRQRKNVALLI